MSSFISLSGEHEFRAELIDAGGKNPHPVIWAISKGTQVAIGLHVRAEAQALIAAAIEADRMLAGAESGQPLYAEPPGVVQCGPGACTCGAHVSADGTVTPADSIVGSRVIRIDDDSDRPLVGEILARLDDEHAEVSWESGTPVRVPLDELRPAGTR